MGINTWDAPPNLDGQRTPPEPRRTSLLASQAVQDCSLMPSIHLLHGQWMSRMCGSARCDWMFSLNHLNTF